jgi:hypothetical protein
MCLLQNLQDCGATGVQELRALWTNETADAFRSRLRAGLLERFGRDRRGLSFATQAAVRPPEATSLRPAPGPARRFAATAEKTPLKGAR